MTFPTPKRALSVRHALNNCMPAARYIKLGDTLLDLITQGNANATALTNLKTALTTANISGLVLTSVTPPAIIKTLIERNGA